jgi:hypothetical protein
MTTQEAVVSVLGKEKYNGMIEAGVSDVSILETACLEIFLQQITFPLLREALREVWNDKSAELRLNFKTQP